MKLHIKLIGDEDIDIIVDGKKKNNVYKYIENNINVSVKYNNKKLYIDRKCNDYTINLVFENKKDTNSTYTVYGGSKIFTLNTHTNKLNVSDDKIELEYILEGNKFKYLLEVVYEGEIKEGN